MALWAVMDIGTNSCRLLIADYDQEAEKLHTLHRALRTTRIGLGMKDGDGYLNLTAMDRTVQALMEYSEVLQHYPIKKVVLLATQALRAARNQKEFKEKIKGRLGWDLEIISGEKEARFSYLGAIQGLAVTGVPLVIDIGGGSTEFICQVDKGNKKYQVHSLPLGALHLWENPLSDDIIQRRLAEALVDFSLPQKVSIVGVGGTATTVAAVKLGLGNYAAEKVQGLKLSYTELKAMYEKLKEMRPEERLQVAGISPGREDIIVSGMQILINIMAYWQAQQVMVSDQDLLQGAIFSNNQ